MKNQALTDAGVRNAKARAEAYRLTDGGGLSLKIHPNGRKVWNSIISVDGKPKSEAIGEYPTCSLFEARGRHNKRRDAALSGEGLDDKPASFGDMAKRLAAKKRKLGRAEGTLLRDERILKKILPLLPAKPIRELKTRDYAAVVTSIAAVGSAENAIRAQGLIGEVCRFACQAGELEADPASPMKGLVVAPRSKGYPAITAPVEVGKLMAGVKAYAGQPLTRLCLELLARSAMRPGECRGLLWDEIDLKAAVVHLPAPRTKTRTARDVYLSKQSVAILEGLAAIRRGELVFPSMTSPLRPMSENTLNQALRRLGYAATEHVSHSFRKTFSTISNEHAKRSDVIERCLGHVDSSIRGVYNLAEYETEQRELMQWYSDYLDGLVKTHAAFN